MGKKGFLATRDRFTLCCFRTAKIPIVVSYKNPACLISHFLGLPTLDALHRQDRLLWTYRYVPGLAAGGLPSGISLRNPSKFAGVLGGVEVLQILNQMDLGLGGKG